MKHILIIDNYDSFTYNLVHYVEQCTDLEVVVKRNDTFSNEDVNQACKVILSPGPGIPEEAGKMRDFLNEHVDSGKPILGVCLGHQAIAERFGGKLENLSRVYHGIQDTMTRTNESCPILGKISDQFEVGRYHSWVTESESLPEELIPTSKDKNGEIMSYKHADLPVFGVQFHPESIMTPTGLEMIRNFVELKA